jgi:hypothetical protein
MHLDTQLREFIAVRGPHRPIPRPKAPAPRRETMNGVIYLVGLVVVVLFILSLLGLR